MKFKLINVFLLIICSNLVLGQVKLHGEIRDKLSNESLPFVDITITYDTFKIKTTTNFDGKFKFEEKIPNNFIISISNIGSIDIDTLISGYNFNNKLLFNLEQEPKIDSIVITYRNKELALSDIKKDELKLFLPGGIISAPRLENDSIFQKRFNIQFVYLGCTRLIGDNFEEYNNEIFKYLDYEYGESWRKEIRKDVIGYKKNKAQH